MLNVVPLFYKSFDQMLEQNWVFKLLALVLAFFQPLHSYAIFLVFLLIADAFTSIYYQMKKSAGDHEVSIAVMFVLYFKTIESSKLRTTLEKLMAYVLWLIICYYADTIFFSPLPLKGTVFHNFSLTNVAMLMMCITELTSITANLSKITKNPIFTQIMGIFKKEAVKKFSNLMPTMPEQTDLNEEDEAAG